MVTGHTYGIHHSDAQRPMVDVDLVGCPWIVGTNGIGSEMPDKSSQFSTKARHVVEFTVVIAQKHELGNTQHISGRFLFCLTLPS
jgi:hypothetical protein